MRTPSAREDEILAAAARMFRAKGYHGTSVRDIAESVGLLKGSLYHYIRSKEELLARLFDGALEGTVRELEAIAVREASASDRLRDMVKAYVRAVTANLDAVGLYLREWRSLPAPDLRRLRAKRHVMRALFEDVIAQGVRAREFAAGDEKIATLAISACATGSSSGTGRAAGFVPMISRISSRSARCGASAARGQCAGRRWIALALVASARCEMSTLPLTGSIT